MEFGSTRICSERRFKRPRSRPIRVMVVDDHEDSAQVVSLYLSTAGFDSCYVTVSPEAEPTAKRYDPDIVLVDINMPDMDGFAVADAMRAAAVTEGVVLVAYTSEAWARIEARALAAGFDGYFRKATVPADLVRLLSAYVRSDAIT